MSIFAKFFVNISKKPGIISFSSIEICCSSSISIISFSISTSIFLFGKERTICFKYSIKGSVNLFFVNGFIKFSLFTISIISSVVKQYIFIFSGSS